MWKKKGQVTHIAPLNHIPLLPSRPGGFCRSWSYKTCPIAKVQILNALIQYDSKKIFWAPCTFGTTVFSAITPHAQQVGHCGVAAPITGAIDQTSFTRATTSSGGTSSEYKETPEPVVATVRSLLPTHPLQLVARVWKHEQNSPSWSIHAQTICVTFRTKLFPTSEYFSTIFAVKIVFYN